MAKIDDDDFMQDTSTDDETEETATTATTATEEVVEAKEQASPKERRARRLLQRQRTAEIEALDTIERSNSTLRNLLKISNASKELFRLVMDAAEEKDRQIIRLRRELLRSRRGHEATRNNLLPRLRSKAQDARVSRDVVRAIKKARITKRTMAQVAD